MSMKIECSKHGEVEFNGAGDFVDDDIITMYCPKCVGEEKTEMRRIDLFVPTRLSEDQKRLFLKSETFWCNQCHKSSYASEEVISEIDESEDLLCNNQVRHPIGYKTLDNGMVTMAERVEYIRVAQCCFNCNPDRFKHLPGRYWEPPPGS